MMATARISITLKGAPKDKGKVRLDVLVAKLIAIQRALCAIEGSTPNGESHGGIYLRIQKIKYSSPLTMTIDVTTVERDGKYSQSLVRTLKSDLISLSKGSDEAVRTPYERLDAYRELAEAGSQKAEAASIKTGRNIIRIDEPFRDMIDKILGDVTAVEKEHGSVTGKLDVINLHGKKQFYIYPTLGATRLKCIFREDLRPKVKAALDQRVNVTGVLHYRKHDNYPFEVEVANIDVLPDDSTLPTFQSLRGIAPNITEGLTAAEYIRKLRDEEW
jgi:hypothetical protein